MTSHIGYGSFISAPITAMATTSLATSGKCVVDKVFVNDVVTGVLDIDIQNAAGTSVFKWTQVDLSPADAQRNGLSCGPLGFAVSGGLQIVTSALIGTLSISIGYRSGLN